MFGSIVLEVLIGLALVYLLLSLVCSTIQEAVSAMRNWRGKMLREAIARLLGESIRDARAATAGSWTARIYAHPLVEALQRKTERAPSYIPNATFAEALVDEIVSGDAKSVCLSASDRALVLMRVLSQRSSVASTPAAPTNPATQVTHAQGPARLELPPNVAKALNLLMDRARRRVDAMAPDAAARTLEAFKQEVCDWYENTMNRATGWYRRLTQFWLFVIATIAVTATNVDTLMIAEQLAHDPKAREAATSAAIAIVEQENASSGAAKTQTPAEAVKRLRAVADESQIQIGWPDPARERLETKRKSDPSLAPTSVEAAEQDRLYWIRKFLGLAITICAVALGAPFWFQVLEKLVKLRSSGSRLVDGAAANAAPNAAGADAEKPPASINATVVTGASSAAGGGSITSVTAVAAGGAAAAPSEKLDSQYWSDSARRWNGRKVKALPPEPDADADDETRRKADAELAVFLARMSALAYEQPWTIEDRLKELEGIKPDTFQFFDSQGTQAFAVRIGDDAIVAYRGTQPTELEDVVADARAALRPQSAFADGVALRFPGRVHMGFASAVRTVMKDVQAWLADEKRGGGNAKRVFFTGHSLGAALATLHFTVRAEPDVTVSTQLVTFGSPRVGDAAFCDDFEQRTLSKKGARRKTRVLRFVNNRDLVTRVAPRNMGFEHVGAECYIDSDGKVLTDEKGAEKWVDFLLLVVDGVAEFRAAAKKPIGDHSMDLYVRRLENWTGWSA